MLMKRRGSLKRSPLLALAAAVLLLGTGCSSLEWRSPFGPSDSELEARGAAARDAGLGVDSSWNAGDPIRSGREARARTDNGRVNYATDNYRPLVVQGLDRGRYSAEYHSLNRNHHDQSSTVLDHISTRNDAFQADLRGGRRDGASRALSVANARMDAVFNETRSVSVRIYPTGNGQWRATSDQRVYGGTQNHSALVFNQGGLTLQVTSAVWDQLVRAAVLSHLASGGSSDSSFDAELKLPVVHPYNSHSHHGNGSGR